MSMASRFHTGVNSVNSLNRLAETAADAGGAAAAAHAAASVAMRKFQGGFFAQLTGTPQGGSAGEYTFQELYLDAAGAWQLLSGGRGTVSGDKAVEIKSLEGLDTGTRVWIQQWRDDADVNRYFFQAAGEVEGTGGTTIFPARIVDAISGAAYSVKEQVCTGAGTFADKSGASALTAYNLAELTLGPGGAVDDNKIVMVMAIEDTGSPPVTRYIFDYPVYAKYLG
jgi:hypothetical protein